MTKLQTAIESLAVLAVAEKAGSIMIDGIDTTKSVDASISRVLAIAAQATAGVTQSCPKAITLKHITNAQRLVEDDPLAKKILELFILELVK